MIIFEFCISIFGNITTLIEFKIETNIFNLFPKTNKRTWSYNNLINKLENKFNFLQVNLMEFPVQMLFKKLVHKSEIALN